MQQEVHPSAHCLVVDDSPGIVLLLTTLLESEGYTVSVAEDGQVALRLTRELDFDLILLDLDLPYVDGYEVCRRLKADPRTQMTPIVVITAQDGFQNKLDAWDLGADDFLPKPFHAIEVLTRCRSLLRIKRLMEQRDSAEAVVFALARAVESKSPYTHGHSERVRKYALLLARALDLNATDQAILAKGALLHDIGKIGVPDFILNKQGPLDPEETTQIRNHPTEGARIIGSLHAVQQALPLIRWHHERMDGAGYPDGLFAAQIPRLVRILSVADVFDSLASERPYRGVLPLPQCIKILEENARQGGLDPELVSCFCELIRTRVPISEHESHNAPVLLLN